MSRTIITENVDVLGMDYHKGRDEGLREGKQQVIDALIRRRDFIINEDKTQSFDRRIFSYRKEIEVLRFLIDEYLKPYHSSEETKNG